MNCFLCSAEDLEDLDEEEMLMRAIALSLEEEEEELCSIKGELLEKLQNMSTKPFFPDDAEKKKEEMTDLDLD